MKLVSDCYTQRIENAYFHLSMSKKLLRKHNLQMKEKKKIEKQDYKMGFAILFKRVSFLNKTQQKKADEKIFLL